MKRLAVALASLALLGAGAANATNPPPLRTAYPAKGNLPTLRVLLLKCAAGNLKVCKKLNHP